MFVCMYIRMKAAIIEIIIKSEYLNSLKLNLQLRLLCACAVTAMRMLCRHRGMNTVQCTPVIYENVFNSDCAARANPRNETCVTHESVLNCDRAAMKIAALVHRSLQL
jgi:hypothetical protein